MADVAAEDVGQLGDGDEKSPRTHEVLILFVLLVLGTFAISFAPWPGVARHSRLLQLSLYVYLPLIPIQIFKLDLRDFGLRLESLGQSLWRLIMVSLIVLPATALAFALLEPGWDPGIDFPFIPTVWDQLLCVAFPEEFFFRGYAQARLDRGWGRRWSVLGARVGPGLLVANALFALIHPLFMGPMNPGSWLRLDVFFPGLIFGWLRNRSESLFEPLIFHAICNLFLFSIVS